MQLDSLNNARELLRQKQFAEAIPVLKTTLNDNGIDDETRARALSNLSLAYAKRKKWEDVLRVYDEFERRLRSTPLFDGSKMKNKVWYWKARAHWEVAISIQFWKFRGKTADPRTRNSPDWKKMHRHFLHAFTGYFQAAAMDDEDKKRRFVAFQWLVAWKHMPKESWCILCEEVKELIKSHVVSDAMLRAYEKQFSHGAGANRPWSCIDEHELHGSGVDRSAGAREMSWTMLCGDCDKKLALHSEDKFLEFARAFVGDPTMLFHDFPSGVLPHYVASVLWRAINIFPCSEWDVVKRLYEPWCVLRSAILAGPAVAQWPKSDFPWIVAVADHTEYDRKLGDAFSPARMAVDFDVMVNNDQPTMARVQYHLLHFVLFLIPHYTGGVPEQFRIKPEDCTLQLASPPERRDIALLGEIVRSRAQRYMAHVAHLPPNVADRIRAKAGIQTHQLEFEEEKLELTIHCDAEAFDDAGYRALCNRTSHCTSAAELVEELPSGVASGWVASEPIRLPRWLLRRWCRQTDGRREVMVLVLERYEARHQLYKDGLLSVFVTSFNLANPAGTLQLDAGDSRQCEHYWQFESMRVFWLLGNEL